MKDPHVVALHYRLESIEGVSYDAPPAVRVQLPAFEGALANGLFEAQMLQHYPSETAARVPVDEYLRAWEIATGVQFGRGEISFRFVRSDVVDRAPPEPGVIRAFARAALPALTATGQVSTHVTRREYPPPPVQFAVDPIVETLWRRYEGHIAGREPIFSMAYYCLTELERAAGSRRDAASKFTIDLKVLGTLGELSTARGDAMEARKAVGQSSRPASGAETAWLQATVRALVQQAARVASGVAPLRLTMSDLPRL